jgi:hypothetical protein
MVKSAVTRFVGSTLGVLAGMVAVAVLAVEIVSRSLEILLF